MADLSLNLLIFIASPSEVMPERKAAEEVILAHVRHGAKMRLLLQPFRWEVDHLPTSGEIQAPLNEPLRRAELVVVILWTRIGDGTRAELERGLEQARLGQSDNVMIYFKTEPSPRTGEKAREEAEQLALLQRDLNDKNLALYSTFRSTDEFYSHFAQDLEKWLRRWEGVPACCQFALENSPTTKGTDHRGDNRLNTLARQFDLSLLEGVMPYLSAEVVTRYQRLGADALRHTFSAQTLRRWDPNWEVLASPRAGRPFVGSYPLQRDNSGNVSFADAEWFCYCCARGLAHAIQEDRVEAVALRPYPNPVHQYLAALVQRSRLSVLPTLRRWLKNSPEMSGWPVARNYAAYTLGMLGAIEAQDDLATAMREDPGEDVSTYCITSLGKLRSRRYLPALVQMFHKETSPRLRLLLSEAVCNTVGIAPYDL